MPGATPHENHSEDKEDVSGIPAPGAEERIIAGFGLRYDPVTGKVKFHHGAAITAEEGSDIIYPMKAGKVMYSGEMQGCGNVVIIDHRDGFITKYAHNKENLVNAGDDVDVTTPVAFVGGTGRAKGPHIHFEAISE